MSRLISMICLAIGLNFGFTPAVGAAESYVSDEIGVTLRSGPTNRYRVIGSLRAGTSITVLQNDATNKSSQVRTKDGKTTGWIKSEYVSSKETVLSQYQGLQNETNQLKQQLQNFEQQLSDKKTIVEQNEELQLKVSELENQVDQLSQQADLQKSRFRKDVFYAGALTVLVSMFIAWLITRTAYGRRQRSGWR
ncbi:TIGR04211 family SH3 domain-containing protein [Kangiella sp. TOML190]|uniref:TIGR04211 family SH3 domain-containing protein n=1 Tax=Kangiella sp. TOML190 TaxID=2931351 RepID=UPI00203BF983|nr:TIGR04211 family SH3 domain-containing protein [Kangiella sp. TOML190]